MARLVYYARERASVAASFPDLALAPCDFDSACDLIWRLAAEYRVSISEILETTGTRRSMWKPHEKTILLNVDYLGWRTAIHEFAHALDEKLRPHSARWHDGKFFELVMDLCRITIERGWHRSIPEERKAREAIEASKQADRAAARAVRAAADAAPAAVRSKKIEKRRAQIARLERKIKGLTTRLSKARRSLAALERAASKGGET